MAGYQRKTALSPKEVLDRKELLVHREFKELLERKVIQD